MSLTFCLNEVKLGSTWISSSSSSSSCLGLMMIWVRTLASSLSSLRALASEAREDNSAVVTFKSRNLFRSSQALEEKVSLIYTVKIISKEITNYIWKVYILRIPLRFQLFRNFSLIRSYLKDLSFAYKVTMSKSSCLRTFHNFPSDTLSTWKLWQIVINNIKPGLPS